MLINRIYELKSLLESAGWRITNEDELLSAADDTIEWLLWHQATAAEDTVTFYLFDSLGRRTSKLKDIFYVRRGINSIELHLDQQDPLKWKADLKAFVYQGSRDV